MRLVPNPEDGIVQAVAQKRGWPQGFAKNLFDSDCAATAALIGFSFSRKIIGIGLGTLLSILGVGRAVALVNHFFRKKMLVCAGLESFSDEP